jgi:hypothetical protein
MAISLIVIALATLMLWGWGQAFRRAFYLEPGTWAANVALGMAVVVFLGGTLTLARMAYPWALAVVAVTGMLLSLIALRAPPVRILLAAPVLIFTIATQLRPSVYNLYDDYQKYFAYPVRMLETGTVFGSPLSAIGMQTLGAQAFLDGFVVAFFPIQYINGVDAVFGLFLCLILASQITQYRLMTMICMLSVIFINPQYVNISTLYCGSALIMAIAACESSPAAVGLLCAALIAMKPTFAVFVAIHLLAMAFVEGWRWTVRTGGATAIFLLPWILVHAPHYVAGLHAHLPPPTPVVGQVETDSLNLFSFATLDYQSSPGNYTLLIAALVICGLICFRAGRAPACCASGVATFFVFIYVLGPIHAGYEHSLRYYAPIAIGLAPAVFGLTANCASRPSWLPVLVAAIPLAAFGPSLLTRVEWALTNHSVASYTELATAPDYVDYNRRVLYGAERETIRAIQEKVPAGEPVLAWVNTPFYLDYKRNRIFDIELAGIGNPWAEIPAARYLILDYNGYATRPRGEYVEFALDVGAGERRNALRALDFIRRIDELVRTGEVIFDSGEIKVVRIRD